MTDEQLALQRLRQGNISGLGWLVEHYGTPAVRTAFLITHDRSLAEDVVQTAFLQVHQHINQYDSARPFKPWFMRIVVNGAIRAARQQQRFSSLDASIPAASDDLTFADLVPDPAPEPGAAYEQHELSERVWAALRQLSPEQRATVVMRYYLELSDEEISGELHIAPSTVRGRLRTARQRLRGLLQQPALGIQHRDKLRGENHG